MEKEAINRLMHLIGVSWVIERDRAAVEGMPSWCIRIGFYWFGVLLFRRWHPTTTHGERLINWNGFAFCYGRNPSAKEGDYIWLSRKIWGFYAA